MKQGYFYIGNKICDGNKIGLIFVLKMSDRNLLKLSRSVYIAKNNSILVVFTPLSGNEKAVFKKHLDTNETVLKDAIKSAFIMIVVALLIGGLLNLMLT